MFWFVHEQVYVFRHDNVSIHADRKAPARYLQLAQEQAACLRRVQPCLTTIATEGDVMKLTALLKTLETPRHVLRI